MKKIGFELVVLAVSFMFLQGSIKGHHYFIMPLLIIAISILGLIKYKNERHSSLLIMTFLCSIFTLANSKLLSANAPAGINKLVMLFCFAIVFGMGLVSFYYIHLHSNQEKKRRFKPKEQQDLTEKMIQSVNVSKQIMKLWKTRKESNIGFLKQIDSLFEKKEEEKNAVIFILGTEVDQDTDSYKYE